MYPRNYFDLFPPFPRQNRVFVAMSFEGRFQQRWENVVAPAIRNVEVDGVALEAHRVDARRVSDSILTEILDGISNDRLIFADITCTGTLNDMPVRNGNVMYEVGIAHAVRLPEEVVLFRSDSDKLLFDVANVRVNSYEPEGGVDAARRIVGGALVEAVRELDLRRHLAVKAAASTLDLTSWWVLSWASGNNGVHHLPTRTMRESVGNSSRNEAIIRLLEIGALSTEFFHLTSDVVSSLDDMTADQEDQLVKYTVTPFGEAIVRHTAHTMGFSDPKVMDALEQRFSTKPAQATNSATPDSAV